MARVLNAKVNFWTVNLSWNVPQQAVCWWATCVGSDSCSWSEDSGGLKCPATIIELAEGGMWFLFVVLMNIKERNAGYEALRTPHPHGLKTGQWAAAEVRLGASTTTVWCSILVLRKSSRALCFVLEPGCPKGLPPPCPHIGWANITQELWEWNSSSVTLFLFIFFAKYPIWGGTQIYKATLTDSLPTCICLGKW